MTEKRSDLFATAIGEAMEVLDELPEEIDSFATLDDELLEGVLNNALLYVVLRHDEPIRKLAMLLQRAQEGFLHPDSLAEIQTGRLSGDPKLHPDMRKVEQQIKTQRAMYLQLQELKNLDTKEDSE